MLLLLRFSTFNFMKLFYNLNDLTIVTLIYLMKLRMIISNKKSINSNLFISTALSSEKEMISHLDK